MEAELFDEEFMYKQLSALLQKACHSVQYPPQVSDRLRGGIEKNPSLFHVYRGLNLK